MTTRTEPTELTTDDLRRRPSVSVEEAARALGISRTQAYMGVRTGEIPSVRVGHRYTIPTSALRRMLGISETLGEAITETTVV